MDTIFMISKNSGTSDPHRLLLSLTDKINLKRSDTFVALSNFRIYYTWKNIKKLCKNNKFKISAPKWNQEFELHDKLYFISNIQDYFEYTLKEHGEKKTENPSISVCLLKIKSRIAFKTKTGFYLELLTPESIQALGGTKNKITKEESDENVRHLEITEVVLVHFNIFDHNYQEDSRVYICS